MDRLPSSHHPDNCGCAECKMFPPRVVRLNERLGLPPLVREHKPCMGKANGCIRECCRPSKKARAAPRSNVVQFPGKPRFAARMKDAA